MSSETGTEERESVAGFPGGAKVGGVTPPTSPGGRRDFLSDVIVDLGFVDRDTVEQAVEAAQAPGRTVARILLEGGALNEDQLSRAIAERHGLDHVDLEEFEVDSAAAALISRSAAVRYRALPVAFATDGALIVALADPVDALAVSDIAVMAKCEVRAAVASDAAIQARIERLPMLAGGHPAAPPSPPQPPDKSPSRPEPARGSALRQATEAEMWMAALKGELASEHAARADLERQGSVAPAADGEREAKTESSHAALEELGASLERAEARSRELDQERDHLRAQVNEVVADRDRMREELERTAAERDRWREEAAKLESSRQEIERSSQAQERLRGDVEALRSELETVRRRANEAEHSTQRVRELEDADRRAEAARLALAELREESDREREQSARLQQKLQGELTAMTEQRKELEGRFTGLLAAASAAREAADKLAALHSALNGEIAEDGESGSGAESRPVRTVKPFDN